MGENGSTWETKKEDVGFLGMGRASVRDVARVMARVATYLISEDGMLGHRPHAEDTNTRTRLCPTTLRNEPCTVIWLDLRGPLLLGAPPAGLFPSACRPHRATQIDRALCLSLPKTSW
ncbi:hypothetical protein N7523_005689 [Penicillium sp. IBT 18751x]|nr:hypothetical protein N7523_005689 [Penicillium sp. IBT 18751x]